MKTGLVRMSGFVRTDFVLLPVVTSMSLVAEWRGDSLDVSKSTHASSPSQSKKNGKPYVSQPVEARRAFNIAHTDGLVMCGIDSQSDDLLGVDVEKLDRRTDPALAKRYFSKPEIDHLENCASETDRRNTFLKIWTLKEAFIKALGTGLQTPLADFAFEKIESAEPEIRFLNPKLESGMHWSFLSIEPRPGYVAAVALGTNSARNEYRGHPPAVSKNFFDHCRGDHWSRHA